jgi:ABC-type dipeptide/oligopeptide/nickel transport system permease subunit
MDALERLIRNKAAMFGLFVSLFMLFLGLFGPFFAPYDHLAIDLVRVHETPSADHWLGTDLLGRDMLSRIMHGGRTAVFVAFVVTVVSVGLGTLFGAAAAFTGGIVDDVVMRVMDGFYSFPELLLAAFMYAVVRRPVESVMSGMYDNVVQWDILKQTLYVDYALVFGALALVFMPAYARIIRGQIISLKERDFIRAERALGVPDRKIIVKHLIPNAISPIVVLATINIGSVMLLESSLSFLGLGIQPPAVSWGTLLQDAQNFQAVASQPWLLIPCLFVVLTVLLYNFLGDGLRDAADPYS